MEKLGAGERIGPFVADAMKGCPRHDDHERGIDRQRIIPGVAKPGFFNRLLAGFARDHPCHDPFMNFHVHCEPLDPLNGPANFPHALKCIGTGGQQRLVRIAVGRDATGVAVATIFGNPGSQAGLPANAPILRSKRSRRTAPAATTSSSRYFDSSGQP
jgi:hypothetical protein